MWVYEWKCELSDLKTDSDYGFGHAGPFSDQRTGGQEDEWKGITRRIQGHEK